MSAFAAEIFGQSLKDDLYCSHRSYEMLAFSRFSFLHPAPTWKEFITPRENPRRRSVGLQNEARFNQLCPTGRSLGFSSGGSKEIGQNLDNGSKNSENQ